MNDSDADGRFQRRESPFRELGWNTCSSQPTHLGLALRELEHLENEQCILAQCIIDWRRSHTARTVSEDCLSGVRRHTHLSISQWSSVASTKLSLLIEDGILLVVEVGGIVREQRKLSCEVCEFGRGCKGVGCLEVNRLTSSFPFR